jgi:hypothetical protein
MNSSPREMSLRPDDPDHTDDPHFIPEPLRAAAKRMNTSEYLFVLVSIVIGLGMSQLLTAVGNLIVDRRRVRFYWVWGVAVLLVFLANVQFWWSTFSVGEAVATNFFSFVFFLTSPITLFLGGVVLVPDFEGEGEIDLKAHFYANHRWCFGFVALLPLLNAIRSVVVSRDPLFMAARPFEAAFFALLVMAAVVQREGWQKAIAVANLCLFVAFIILVGLKPG